MFGFIKRLFRKKKVVSPFAKLLEAMRAKDAELARGVGPMPILDGMRRWKEKYPEDFPELD